MLSYENMVTSFEKFNQIIDVVPLLVFVTLLFIVGLIGFVISYDYIILPMLAIELMIFASIIFYAIIAVQSGNDEGFVASIILFAIAAAESVVGLSILVLFFRFKGTISLHSWSKLNR